MIWKIGMPNLGHTMEEGKVSQWIKSVGDRIEKGEVIAIVETDKASFDIESPADGVLISINALAGSVVPVGESIGHVGEPGEIFDESKSMPQLDIKKNVGIASLPVAASNSQRLKISPAARALAEELGIDCVDILGSGDDGMITRDDVRAYKAVIPAKESAEAKLLSPMRRAIAEATMRSWQTIPHVPLQSHADVTLLLAKDGISLTAAITRACALALIKHPAFNGWLVDNAFEASKHANIALAMSTPAGLVTAVLPASETKSVRQLSTEISALAESANNGSLNGSKMTGASFTISSLGRWGVDAFSPIISAPQLAILGVGRINRVAREGPDASVRFASEISLTLVFDHRANDGLEAAEMLTTLVGFLEQPETLELHQ